MFLNLHLRPPQAKPTQTIRPLPITFMVIESQFGGEYLFLDGTDSILTVKLTTGARKNVDANVKKIAAASATDMESDVHLTIV
jgi:hypothetical protein